MRSINSHRIAVLNQKFAISLTQYLLECTVLLSGHAKIYLAEQNLFDLVEKAKVSFEKSVLVCFKINLSVGGPNEMFWLCIKNLL